VQEQYDPLLKFRNYSIDGLPDGIIKQIAIAEIPAEHFPADHKYHNRLLNRGELIEASGPVVRYGDVRKEAEDEQKES